MKLEDLLVLGAVLLLLSVIFSPPKVPECSEVALPLFRYPGRPIDQIKPM